MLKIISKKASRYFLIAVSILFSSIAWGACPVPQPGQDVYFVSTDGSNSNPGTEAQPWRSPLYAMRNAPGGSFVYIKEGTYNSYPYSALEPTIPGTPEQWSVFANYPGHKVTITSRGARYGLDLQRIRQKDQYIHYCGFEISNYEKLAEGDGPSANLILQDIEMHTARYGLRLRNCSDMKFLGMYVHHTGESGFSFRNCENIVVKNTESSYNDDGKTDSDADGLQTYGGKNMLIERFIARFNREDGLDLNCDCTVLYSELTNNGAVGLKAWRRSQDDYEAKHVFSIGNLYANNKEAGIKTSEGPGLTMYHDTVVGNGEAAVVIKSHSRPGEEQYVLMNNIFLDNGNQVEYGRGVHYGHGGGLPASRLSESHNLYFNNNGQNTIGFTPNFPLEVDALLQDEDYKLGSLSPAIDAGTLIPGLHKQVDDCNNGNSQEDGAWPYVGLAPDLGRYEFGRGFIWETEE